jgi:hypothetical protein
MGRMTWLQLRSGAVRSVALLLGMLLATTAFTVLTAASRTAQLRTIGTVSAHFVPAYDILVRPNATRTKLDGSEPIGAIWTAGPVTYRSSLAGSRSPFRVTNPSSVWDRRSPRLPC